MLSPENMAKKLFALFHYLSELTGLSLEARIIPATEGSASIALSGDRVQALPQTCPKKLRLMSCHAKNEFGVSDCSLVIS
jgi:hypothetical protein